MSGYHSNNQFTHYGEAFAMDQIENGWLLGGNNDLVIRQAVCPIMYTSMVLRSMRICWRVPWGYIITALREGYKLRWCAVGGGLRYRSIYFLHLNSCVDLIVGSCPEDTVHSDGEIFRPQRKLPLLRL